MKEEPASQTKVRKTIQPRNRASASGGSGGSNLQSLFADVSSSFKQVCKSISSSTSPQAAVAPHIPPVSAIDAALDLFSLDYSKMFSVPDGLLFKRFLADNDRIPGMFMRLDPEERIICG